MTPSPVPGPELAVPEIDVQVDVRHLPDHSTAQRQVFGYVITIRNRGGDTWQLVARHWDIQDARGNVVTVDGEGVVGEQPILAPGAQYTYNSFVTLDTAPGVMEGHYVMRDAWGQPARVPIRPFRLDAGGERILN